MTEPVMPVDLMSDAYHTIMLSSLCVVCHPNESGDHRACYIYHGNSLCREHFLEAKGWEHE